MSVGKRGGERRGRREKERGRERREKERGRERKGVIMEGRVGVKWDVDKGVDRVVRRRFNRSESVQHAVC